MSGSTHDSFILSSSYLHDRFENEEFGNSWLLGDSGYALKRWLITPLSTPVTSSEKNLIRHIRQLGVLLNVVLVPLKVVSVYLITQVDHYAMPPGKSEN